MTRCAEGDAGFTLLELLVAMTVLALLTALLFGGLEFGTRVWKVGDAELERFARTDTAFALMRRTMMAASPKLVFEARTGQDRRAGHRRSDGEPAVDFEGLPDGVRFVGPAPAAVLGGGLYRLAFGVIGQDGVGQLIFAWQPQTPEAERDPEAATSRVLLDGIARARFAYFGTARDDDAAQWHDRWQNQPTLPMIVSVQVEFQPGDRRVWPQLLVAPMLGMPLQ
ncbi:MAG: prepilin-type N-terminal cleavage/methylation domain-containing protein [Rhodospirillales bacterium]|nr:prepilin-type N-terminal cleavage/methylation domain-containing protein [Rhodospirillales bacterium]